MGALREQDSFFPCVFRHGEDIFIPPGDIHTPSLKDLTTPLGPLSQATRFIGDVRFRLYHAGNTLATVHRERDPAYWYTTPVPPGYGRFVSLRKPEGVAEHGEHSCYFFYDGYFSDWSVEPVVMIELPRVSPLRQNDVLVCLNAITFSGTHGPVKYVIAQDQGFNEGKIFLPNPHVVDCYQSFLLPYGSVIRTYFLLAQALTIPVVDVYYGQAVPDHGFERQRNLPTDVLAVIVWPFFRDLALLSALNIHN